MRPPQGRSQTVRWAFISRSRHGGSSGSCRAPVPRVASRIFFHGTLRSAIRIQETIGLTAAESIDRSVSLRHIRDGIYDRGKSRTNRREAEAIVEDLVQRMKRCLKRPEAQRLTDGVVTFNSQQQELIQDLLYEALRQNSELEWFFQMTASNLPSLRTRKMCRVTNDVMLSRSRFASMLPGNSLSISGN